MSFLNVCYLISELTLRSYYDQEVGMPSGAGSNETHIDNMLFQNFAGTIDEYVSSYYSISHKADHIFSSGRIEGSCVTDPCWYYVEGMTGKEVSSAVFRPL